MELIETIEKMKSPDYKERFLAEYQQLKIRHDKLAEMLKKYRDGTLPFAPNCPYELLHEQLVFMECYIFSMEKRAEFEDIYLGEDEEHA